MNLNSQGAMMQKKDHISNKIRYIKLTIAFLLLVLATTSNAQIPNDVRSIEIASGQTSEIGRRTGWWDDCSQKSITIYDLQEPRYGTIEIEEIDARIGYDPGGGVLTHGSYGSCLGEPTKAKAIMYTPDENFEGMDTVRFKTRYGDGTVINFTIIITVY